jgi:hypothetical protein
MRIAPVEMHGTDHIVLFPKSPLQDFCHLFPDCLRVFLDKLALLQCAVVGLLGQRNDGVVSFHHGTLFRK